MMSQFQQLQRLRALAGDKIGFFTLILMMWGACWPVSSFAQFRSQVDLGLAGDTYMTRENVNNGQAHGSLVIDSQHDNGAFYVNIGAGGLISQAGHSYIKAPELYYRWGQKEKINFVVGRFESQWSQADHLWELGLTQPLFLWDAARPEQQGLSGFFLNYPTSSLNFKFFASFLYLPTQGPTYQNSNGQLTSSNPWFVDPIEAINFGGQRFGLNYGVELPAVTQIILQPSFGVQMQSKEKSSVLFNAFYLIKPRNDLALPFEGALNSSTLEGDIVVQPRVARHQLSGIDLGLRHKTYGDFYFSWLYEGGIRYSAPDNTTFPGYPDQNIFSLTSALKFFKKMPLWLSFLHTQRSETAVKGVFGSSSVNTYLFRNRFDKAIRLKTRVLLQEKSEFLPASALSLSYTYDTEGQGSWISGVFQWNLTKNLNVYTQCDLFGGPGDVIVGDHFINIYQNNDRCLVGGHYVF